MSDPVITSEADYERNDAMMSKTAARIRLQALDENWPSERVTPVLVDALLPYYRAKTEPASLAARIMQQRYRDNYDGTSVMLDVTRDPQVAVMVAQQTETLNAFHGTHYPPPPVIILEGLQKNTNSPLQFNKDAILIDREFFETNRNNPLLAGGIGHELAHRYQRSDDVLRRRIAATVLQTSPSEREQEIDRVTEAEADLNARRVTPKGMMTDFLKEVYSEEAINFAYYLKSHPEVTVEDNAANYGELSKRELDQLKRDTSALPQTERDAYFTLGVHAIDSLELEKSHPKIMDRLSLQAALDSDPSILSCRNILVAENATITEATDCGPKNVPMLADNKNINDKLSR